MADEKLTALTALTTLTGDDLFYAVDDPAGTPVQRKVTAAVVRQYIFNTGFSAIADGTNTQSLTTGTGTTLIHGGSGGALKTLQWDIEGWFTQSTGIFFPQEAGKWLIGASAVIGNVADAKFMAVYISHSTDGSSWSDSGEKGVIAWRGAASATQQIGGSGGGIVDANGTTDRWSLRIFHTDSGTPIIPATSSVRPWCRFWAMRTS